MLYEFAHDFHHLRLGKLCRLLAKCCAFAVKREHRRKRLLGKSKLAGRLCHRAKTRKIAVCQRCAEFLGGFFGRMPLRQPPERQTAACKNRRTQGGGKDASKIDEALAAAAKVIEAQLS